MNVAIGADHRGFELKEYLKKMYTVYDDKPITWIDVGAYNNHRSDYPVFAHEASLLIQKGSATYGILLCGTGVGMAIVANRYHGVYAGLAWNEEVAVQSKQHDNTNVLVLPADYMDAQQTITIVDAWFKASFLAGRYRDRFIMIDRKI
jgi:ribose 5-phosphate isomerase B